MKNVRHTLGAVALAFTGMTALTAPTINQNSVTMTQDSARNVIVTYVMTGENGIVTLDIETNVVDDVWASIGGENIRYVSGDVNKIVKKLGETCTIKWRPTKSWPDKLFTGGKVRAVVKAWDLSEPPNYLVADCVNTKDVQFYEDASFIPGGVHDDLYKMDKMIMRKILAANVRWRMGSPTTEVGRNDSEIPHEVVLTADYYMAIYEMTHGQYMRLNNLTASPSSFYTTNPSRTPCPDWKISPVQCVKVNNLRGTAANGYDRPANLHKVGSGTAFDTMRKRMGLEVDLPTEAQWEFACRAGVGAAYYTGDELGNKDAAADANVERIAWYLDNSNLPSIGTYAPQPVGQKEANAWGLYDMIGNVQELCLDWYSEKPWTADSVEDPKGPESGSTKVCRGGNFVWKPARMRSAYHDSFGTAGLAPDNIGESTGFRLVCPIDFSAL